MSVRRLESEAVRDSVLAVSGKLNRKLYGEPVPVMEDEVGQIVIGKENLDGERKPTGKISLLGEEYRRSLATIKRHVELHPDDSHAIFLGALALLDLDERNKALLWVRRAQAIDPRDPYLLYGMGCFYCRIGDTDL